METTSIYLERTLLLLDQLPDFCERFFLNKQTKVSDATQYNYASRMKLFLIFLIDNIDRFNNFEISNFTLNDLFTVTENEGKEFIEHLISQGKSNSTASAYVESISTYYDFFTNQKINLPGNQYINPFKNIKIKRSSFREPIFLDEHTQAILFSSFDKEVDDENSPKVDLRDIAIVQLILDTGIKVSELVSLDIDDVDLRKNYIYVSRNNDEATLNFSSHTAKILKTYIDHRSEMCHADESQRALFLSTTRGKNLATEKDTAMRPDYNRLTVRSVQRIVKKYAKRAGISNSDKITPQTLRDTYAIQMLGLSKDPALVRKLLNQKDISMYFEEALKMQAI